MTLTKKQKTTYLIITVGVLICCLSFGLRASMGLFMTPISLAHDWGRETISFAIALQNLFWGLLAPVAGYLANRFGNVRVIIIGALIYALGLALIPLVSQPWLLHGTVGLLIGTGISATSFGIVLPAMARMVSASKRTLALGLGTAGGSAGQFIVVLLSQDLIDGFGWQQALFILALIALLIIVLALPLSKANAGLGVDETDEENLPLKQILKIAFSQRSYWYVILGFYVCGFQLAFMTAHMPAYITDFGFSNKVAAMSLAIIGLCNIFGAYYAGVLAMKYPKKFILFWIYLLRAIAITLFLLMPISLLSIYLFSCITGFLWLATIPPTSGLVAQMFGTRNMTVLYGIVFLNHQLGSFTGVWLGGYLYDVSGSYSIVWLIAIVLAIISALVHLPVQEKSLLQTNAGTT